MDAAGTIAEMSDAQLAARAGAGEEAALNELFERYRRPLYAYFNRMLDRDTASADDLFQEVWIKVIDKLQKGAYREDGKFGAWLFRVARNQTLEHFRRCRSRAKLGEVTADGELPDVTGGEPDPGAILGAEELAVRLEAALLEMPREMREVFSMRQNDLSFKEIAEIQKCPVNTALGRMHNALKFLRKKLLDN